MNERKVSLIATRKEIILSTSCVMPPIPVRSLDWQAVTGSYDGGYIGEDGSEYSKSPMGMGETEAEAIDNLLDELETA